MKASFLDLRKRSKALLKALEHNEEVAILCRGQLKGVIVPAARRRRSAKGRARAHPAFGLWADRQALADVDAHVRRLRKGRFNAL